MLSISRISRYSRVWFSLVDWFSPDNGVKSAGMVSLLRGSFITGIYLCIFAISSSAVQTPHTSHKFQGISMQASLVCHKSGWNILCRQEQEWESPLPSGYWLLPCVFKIWYEPSISRFFSSWPISMTRGWAFSSLQNCHWDILHYSIQHRTFFMLWSQKARIVTHVFSVLLKYLQPSPGSDPHWLVWNPYPCSRVNGLEQIPSNAGSLSSPRLVLPSHFHFRLPASAVVSLHINSSIVVYGKSPGNQWPLHYKTVELYLYLMQTVVFHPP